MNGKHYKVGSFISEDCSGDCVCYRNGRIGCNSLCPPVSERCRSGEKEVTVQEPVGRGSNCKCPVQKCVPGEKYLLCYLYIHFTNQCFSMYKSR